MFFLPLFDNNPTSRTPIISYLILISCVTVFLWQLGLSGYEERKAFFQLGIIPSVLLGTDELPINLALIPDWLTIFSSMFLHGGWLHLGSNMLYLWIFADNVEDSMGPFRFILFYALCGVGAGLCQAMIDPSSQIPIIGASGGIAGILGAYILLHPRATVRVFMLILIFVRIISLPAWLVLGVNKTQLIKINETNKNDITRILGPVHIKDEEEKRWSYFEVRKTKTKLGKTKVYVNDYIEIYFDNYGIAKKVDFYDLESMQQITFSKENTKTLGVKDTFSKNLLSSTRKRLENARKKFD